MHSRSSPERPHQEPAMILIAFILLLALVLSLSARADHDGRQVRAVRRYSHELNPSGPSMSQLI
jgi:hypothetical protein